MEQAPDTTDAEEHSRSKPEGALLQPRFKNPVSMFGPPTLPPRSSPKRRAIVPETMSLAAKGFSLAK